MKAGLLKTKYLKVQRSSSGSIVNGLLTSAIFAFSEALYAATAVAADSPASFSLGSFDSPDAMVPAIKILLLLTVLTVAPAILLLTTCFSRFLIVLGFVRQAIGTQALPPNQVLLGLALFLTYFTMEPIWSKIYTEAYVPYRDEKITQEVAFEKTIDPIKTFMLAQTGESDLMVFMNIAGLDKPRTQEEVPLRALMPAFMVSELKIAFQIGFLIFVPFLVIDMVVSSVLMAMGMLMLPPTVISLPFKLVLFVLVDGWSMIVQQVVSSVHLAAG